MSSFQQNSNYSLGTAPVQTQSQNVDTGMMAQVAGGATTGATVGGPWGAIIGGAAAVGVGLLQGIFQQKLAEEDRAYKEQQAAKDRLRQAQMQQVQAPLQAAQGQSSALQSLVSNWGGTRR